MTEQLVRLGAGEWLRKEPKTGASVRSVSISPFTASLLAEHLEMAMKRSGVRLRFHDLRHTSVALAIAEGAHPKAI